MARYALAMNRDTSQKLVALVRILHETFIITRKNAENMSISNYFLFLFECLVPLLNVLSVHLRTMVKWPLWQQFITFYETQCNESMVLEIKSVSELVPNILKDPVALLIEYQLLAPLRMDIGKKSSD